MFKKIDKDILADCIKYIEDFKLSYEGSLTSPSVKFSARDRGWFSAKVFYSSAFTEEQNRAYAYFVAGQWLAKFFERHSEVQMESECLFVRDVKEGREHRNSASFLVHFMLKSL